MSTQLLKAITNFFVIYIHYVTTWWFYYTLILFSFIGSTKWPLWKIILTLIHSHVLTVSKQDPSAGLPSTLTLSCPHCLSSSALWYEGSSPSPTAPALLGSLPPPGQPWNSNILQFKSVSLIVMVKFCFQQNFNNVFTNSWFISWCFFFFFSFFKTLTFFRCPRRSLKISSCSWYSARVSLPKHREIEFS